ncbi:hypothetical protein HDV02_000330 [Globomyces sp. JEL0801]|nr:hypothetical protein HDV02_000330 [Globomyces sp. JEL0801]
MLESKPSTDREKYLAGLEEQVGLYRQIKQQAAHINHLNQRIQDLHADMALLCKYHGIKEDWKRHIQADPAQRQPPPPPALQRPLHPQRLPNSPPHHHQQPPPNHRPPPNHQQAPSNHQQGPPNHQQGPLNHQQAPPNHQQPPQQHPPPSHQPPNHPPSIQQQPSHQQQPSSHSIDHHRNGSISASQQHQKHLSQQLQQPPPHPQQQPPPHPQQQQQQHQPHPLHHSRHQSSSSRDLRDVHMPPASYQNIQQYRQPPKHARTDSIESSVSVPETAKKARYEVLANGTVYERRCGDCGATHTSGHWCQDNYVHSGHICQKCYRRRRRSQTVENPEGNRPVHTCELCRGTKTPNAWHKHPSIIGAFVCEPCHAQEKNRLVQVATEPPTRTCVVCKGAETTKWYTENGIHICRKCNRKRNLSKIEMEANDKQVKQCFTCNTKDSESWHLDGPTGVYLCRDCCGKTNRKEATEEKECPVCKEHSTEWHKSETQQDQSICRNCYLKQKQSTSPQSRSSEDYRSGVEEDERYRNGPFDNVNLTQSPKIVTFSRGGIPRLASQNSQFSNSLYPHGFGHRQSKSQVIQLLNPIKPSNQMPPIHAYIHNNKEGDMNSTDVIKEETNTETSEVASSQVIDKNEGQQANGHSTPPSMPKRTESNNSLSQICIP